jgi:hypothetical protein
VYTFMSASPGAQSILQCALVACFGLAHSVAAPLRSPASQTLQRTLLACLVVVAACGVPDAVALSSASRPHPVPFAAKVQTLFGIVVPVAAGAWAFLGAAAVAAVQRLRAKRTGRQTLQLQ